MSGSDAVTKRLHISGLTPSLTASDLTKRLSTFGNVLSADGFGLTDALGDPRKFGYITIETTKGQLAKCLNVLSGSTWKGTKLRIGEARPDYRERLEKEHEKISDPPPKKRRISKYGAVAAPDLHQLVTPESAAQKPGWKVTPGGRIIRPMRMRPDHPLPPPLYANSKSKTKNSAVEKKSKRQKPPPARARRKTIDPTNWDSTQLKGMFLDVEPSTFMAPMRTIDDISQINPTGALSSTSDESSESEEEAEEIVPSLPSPEKIPLQPPATKPTAIIEPIPSKNPPPAPTVAVDDPLSSSNLHIEKAQALNLLQGLFEDTADWIGREELDSDIDEQDIVKAKNEKNRSPTTHDLGDYEVVPMDADSIVEDQEAEGKHQEPKQAMDVDNDENDGRQHQELEAILEEDNSVLQDDVQEKKLKDLFAPREEEAGFSLLGHLDLDLDLELEDDLLLSGPPHTATQAIPAPAAPVAAHEYLVPVPTSAKSSFDPSRPLFFPSSRPGARDLFAVARERGWKPSDFQRTETEDEIRKRWEDSKLELTRDWKKRAREAAKLRRRRGGGAGADDMK